MSSSLDLNIYESLNTCRAYHGLKVNKQAHGKIKENRHQGSSSEENRRNPRINYFFLSNFPAFYIQQSGSQCPNNKLHNTTRGSQRPSFVLWTGHNNRQNPTIRNFTIHLPNWSSIQIWLLSPERD